MLARMMARVKMHLCTQLLALVSLALIGWGSALAQGAPPDEKSRWVPSLGISSGAFVQRFQGQVNTGGVVCESPEATTPLCFNSGIAGSSIQDGAPVTGRERAFTPFIAASLELSTPTFASSIYAPSAFARLDFAYTFGFSRAIALIDSPGAIERSDDVAFYEARYYKGQGSDAVYTSQDFQFSAGVGLAFHLEIADRKVRVKPSLEYMREAVNFTGLVSKVIHTEGVNQAEYKVRYIQLSGQKETVFHSIGPGLEVEMDTGRAGPVVLSIFGGGQAYAILGDNQVSFDQTNEYGETAEWNFLANRWFFRGSVGLRFRWLPE
ncbi:MAG: hypothetical protein CL917_17500 [Deltaproteobacteria bacterium]|nr:hypothetical protein [Deltaproteobacteria bacterium]